MSTRRRSTRRSDFDWSDIDWQRNKSHSRKPSIRVADRRDLEWGIWDVQGRSWLPDPRVMPVDNKPARYATQIEAERAADRNWRRLNPGDQFDVKRFTDAPHARQARQIRDYPGGGDIVNVFFYSTSVAAYQQAAKLARVIESALDNPMGRWRLEQYGSEWVMKYGPIDSKDYRKVQAAIERRFGKSVFVLYTAGR